MSEAKFATVLFAVAAEFQVPTSALLSAGRTQPAAWARQVAMWLLFHQGFSKAKISKLFSRDHKTVPHAIRTVEDRCTTYQADFLQVARIREKVLKNLRGTTEREGLNKEAKAA